MRRAAVDHPAPIHKPEYALMATARGVLLLSLVTIGLLAGLGRAAFLSGGIHRYRRPSAAH